MKPFNGYEAKKSGGARELLPAGGYVAEIKAAEEVSYTWGSVVVISFDICEGQYKEFFAKDYRANTNDDKKWRGTYRLNIPKDDGSEQDGWTKKSFNNAIWSLEVSNPGYHFDWDEKKFKGKKVGVLFRNKQWAMNGNTGWTTECCAFTSIEDIRSGSFTMPKDKPLAKEINLAPSGSAFGAFVAADDDNGDLPF